MGPTYEQRKIFGTSSNWRGVPTSFSSPVWFLKAWPRTPLPYRVWVPYFLNGWPAGGLAGWVGWLAGWLLAGWVAGCWLAGWLFILYGRLVFDGCGLLVLWAWIWPRSDLVLDLCTAPEAVLYQQKTMNIKCLHRIRGVPTSFYKLNMMFSTNQGTPQYYSSLQQIKAVAHIKSHQTPWS